MLSSFTFRIEGEGRAASGDRGGGGRGTGRLRFFVVFRCQQLVVLIIQNMGPGQGEGGGWISEKMILETCS